MSPPAARVVNVARSPINRYVEGLVLAQMAVQGRGFDFEAELGLLAAKIINNDEHRPVCGHTILGSN